MKNIAIVILLSPFVFGCGSQKPEKKLLDSKVIVEVNADYFTSANESNQLTKVPCTLSDGTKTECYQIITNSTPSDHQMGPWCPADISDGADAGGIWLQDGKVHDVDGAFVKNLAFFYKDTSWRMYDANGKIFVTETEQECINAANPNVGEAYKNFCVECLPSFISNISNTYLIPVKPVFIEEPIKFMGPGGRGRPNEKDSPSGDRPQKENRPPPGNMNPKDDRPDRGGPPGKGGNGIPSTRGISLNGVEFSAPAPLNNILSAYTLAPFDDAGGHINVHQGYHYHAATGVSYSINQKDQHPALIGYAIDGHGIYARLNSSGEESEDLDECRGHYDEIRGYHYHVDAAGQNNFINCIHGAYAK